MKKVGLASLLLVALAFALQACNLGGGTITSEQQAKKAETLRKISETGHNRPGRDDEDHGGG